MRRPDEPRFNHLLAALPAADWQRWQHLLQPLPLPLGRVLWQPGPVPLHAIFPTSAVLSVRMELQDGAGTEVAVIGREGMLGTAHFMGGTAAPASVVVQTAGQGFSLRADLLVREFAACPAAMKLLLVYTQSIITQMAQTVVCNRHHSLDQKLCRWLLQHLDHLPHNAMDVTQEAIAQMLGVRREGVTEAMGHLQRAGLLYCSRGHITVTDRSAMERRSCECYAVVRAENRRLLPDLAQQGYLPEVADEADEAEAATSMYLLAAQAGSRGLKPVKACARAV